MQYSVKQAKDGYYEAIVKNPSFDWQRIYAFSTEQGAQDFITAMQDEANATLAGIPTFSEYFKV
jgi:hypothetical protein